VALLNQETKSRLHRRGELLVLNSGSFPAIRFATPKALDREEYDARIRALLQIIEATATSANNILPDLHRLLVEKLELAVDCWSNLSETDLSHLKVYSPDSTGAVGSDLDQFYVFCTGVTVLCRIMLLHRAELAGLVADEKLHLISALAALSELPFVVQNEFLHTFLLDILSTLADDIPESSVASLARLSPRLKSFFCFDAHNPYFEWLVAVKDDNRSVVAPRSWECIEEAMPAVSENDVSVGMSMFDAYTRPPETSLWDDHDPGTKRLHDTEHGFDSEHRAKARRGWE